MTSLAALVQEAKQNPAAATGKLGALLKDIFPDLGITDCVIHSGSKVSLNSVNGTLSTTKGEALFFKFHAEEGEQQSLIAAEYYRAQMLAEQGWPVITPVAVSTTPGRQCVVYPKLSLSTAYDLYGAQDALFLDTGSYDTGKKDLLLKAEAEYLRRGTAIVLKTLEAGSAENAKASLHQLFSHRLHSVAGSTPRLDLFYSQKPVTMPDGSSMDFDVLAKKTFIVNGREYPLTLAEMIRLSKQLLHADAMNHHPSCISHGDDHNGNKFLMNETFVAFDPAFAGRHPVLLGLIKGLMHNGPLHPFWYYEPERVIERLELDFKLDRDTVIITHNGAGVLHAPMREETLALHLELVWRPVLREMKKMNVLPQDWLVFTRCAAFCCPFLALNMINVARHPDPKLSLFNLAQCMAAFHMDAFKFLLD